MELEFQFFSETEDSEVIELFEPGKEHALKVRLDKWLWAARFFKTRAVARAAVEKGRVFYNGERSKPNREIEIGATLQIRHGHSEKAVIIKGLSTRRRSTEEALALFEETEDGRLALEQNPEWQSPSNYFPNQEKSSTNHPASYFQHDNQPIERRAVRFLRRTFVRGDTYHKRVSQKTPESLELEIFE